MLTTLELLAAGLGLTVDTVLAVALMERRNRAALHSWMVTFAAGAWFWHGGNAGYFWSTGFATASPGLRWLSMLSMLIGLLLMPCSLLHAVLRLSQTGWTGQTAPVGWRWFLYLPVALAAPIAGSLQGADAGSFLEQVEPWMVPYLAAITIINAASAAVVWRIGRRTPLPGAPRFFAGLSLLIGSVTVALNVSMFVVMRMPGDSYHAWIAVIILLPVLPSLWFAYAVIRFGFFPLVVERSLIYGGLLAVAVMLHQSIVRRVEASWQQRVGIDLALAELVLVLAVVLGYAPIRRRVREALRYLLGPGVVFFRERLQRASVDLAARSGESPLQLAAWMRDAVQSLFPRQDVQVLLRDEVRQRRWEASSRELLSPERAAGLCDRLREAGLRLTYADQAPTRGDAELLLEQRVVLAVRGEYQTIEGLILIGGQAARSGWGDEELGGLLLLTEQWAGAVSNSLLQSDRQSAERRAWQNEKLSALGLLAGSIAHEIKNPLSSMKTLTAVALEESDPGSDHAATLRLVLQEIDRLAGTTSQLLSFVRPSGAAVADAAEAARQTVQVAGHLARQRQVLLSLEVPESPLRTIAPGEALRSILLNLTLNALEACPPSGRVTVRCRGAGSHVVLEVIDTGPGLAPEVQDHLFDAFQTTKAQGTGLGLYSVACTVRDLEGSVECESSPGAGATFRVRLPRNDQESAT
ncbi:sensor histidine kinase [Planctellipticum variicoloris]|uniref:sensor histidine kinase n=1 Tax=Planctellipticum variicoloris TaxID=3064265 RepID=UPI003013DD8B|nr:ATP-binding protein [Planctomycetaceae bacterium SH412]